MEYRMETDSIGAKEVPADAYYGISALRGAENFRVTGQGLREEMIRSLAEIKKAAALCHRETGELAKDKADAIVFACDELLAGKYRDQFLCDPLQGGAGTTIHMNANEVIANVAIERLGGKKGEYSLVHPNDHVNLGQSTNDVIPTAARMTAYRLVTELLTALSELEAALLQKAEEFHHVIKMGRTQMQDAVPIRLGSEFKAYAAAVSRDRVRLARAAEELLAVNLGGTAVGTALNADPRYLRRVIPALAEISGLKLIPAADLVDGTQNADSFAYCSASLKTAALSLSKMSNDLRLMSSGPRCGLGEIRLPPMQNGSSIMPGKINPVIPELMSQVSFLVVGNDVCISMAAEAGQLELNFAAPVLYFKLFESCSALTSAVKTLTQRCIVGITAEKERIAELLEQSVGVVTAICPKVGYARAAAVAKEAVSQNKSVRQVLRESGFLSEEEIRSLLDPASMV